MNAEPSPNYTTPGQTRGSGSLNMRPNVWSRVCQTTIKLVKVAFWVLVILTTLEHFVRNAFELAVE